MSTKAFQVVNSGLKFSKGKDRLVGMIKSDTHTSYPGDKTAGKSERAWECFLQAIKIVKPDFIIDIGDAGEWMSVSAWEWKRTKRPPIKYVCRELLRDGAAVSKDLRDLEKILPKDCQKFFIQGNHDQWVDNFVNEQVDDKGISVLDPQYQFESLVGLKSHGWKYFEHGKWVKFGKLYVSHGTMAKGVNHWRNMVLRMGVNVLYGHTHDLGSHPVGSLGGTHKAFTVGCLAQMNKAFLRGDMTNWEHGFCLLNLKKNGNFQVHQHSIYGGECEVYGKVIKV